MNEKNHSFNSIEKKSVLSLISKNEKIISEFKSRENTIISRVEKQTKMLASLFSNLLIDKILWLYKKIYFTIIFIYFGPRITFKN